MLVNYLVHSGLPLLFNIYNKLRCVKDRSEISKYFILLLLMGGDVESNPGPPITYTQMLQIIQNKENYLEYVHLNFQDLRKYSALRSFISDLGPNTILAVTETWLKDDDLKTRDVSPQTHKRLSCYRISTSKSKGCGILLYIPIQLEPKEKPKLNLCNVEHLNLYGLN